MQNGLKTTIDKAGRVVIPAAIRARIGLRAGTELEIVVEEDSIRLVRRAAGPTLTRVGNRLIARPTVPASEISPVDVAALIDEERARWPW